MHEIFPIPYRKRFTTWKYRGCQSFLRLLVLREILTDPIFPGRTGTFPDSTVQLHESDLVKFMVVWEQFPIEYIMQYTVYMEARTVSQFLFTV
jgi:hypothetical protein